jgi:hypothetical protein
VGEIDMMSIWRHLRTMDLFSSALFCLWLSTASLLPSQLMDLV